MTLQFVINIDGPTLIFTDIALAQMTNYCQNSGSKEAGGQLFGLLKGQNVLITEATPPSLKDRRNLFGFIPNRQREQEDIHNRYPNGLHFVGDWHTHPQGIPVPSNTDLASIRDCFEKSKHDLQYFVLAIIGTDPLPQGIYVSLVNSSDIVEPKLIL